MAGVCAAGRLKLLEPCIRLAGADGLSGRKHREVSRNVSLHFLLDFHDEKVQFCFEKGRVCYNTGTISLEPPAAVRNGFVGASDMPKTQRLEHGERRRCLEARRRASSRQTRYNVL